MSKSKLSTAPDKSSEIELTVIGRKSGRKISMPVWFVHGDNILYPLPLQDQIRTGIKICKKIQT